MTVYTILGAGGSIGNSLANELIKQNRKVRLVSRSGFSWPGATTFKADLTQLSEAIECVRGSKFVFLCVGLPYDHKVWAKLWPRIMSHTIEACKRAKARLIFFDNVYMYGQVKGLMNERTPYYPCTRKGEVRAEIARLLYHEMKRGDICASIARAADLYGPYATRNSIPWLMVFDNLLHHKGAQWLVNDKVLHSFSYTIDCARAMVMLADNEASFNKIWHLPTCQPGITGREFIELVARELNVRSRYFILRPWMISLTGCFNRTVQESMEMLYEYKFEYQFDSSRFEQYFKFTPTSYPLGISETVSFYNKNI